MSFLDYVAIFGALVLAVAGGGRFWNHDDRWINVVTGALAFAMGALILAGIQVQ